MISKLLQLLFKHIDAFLMTCLFFALLTSLFVLYSACTRTRASRFDASL